MKRCLVFVFLFWALVACASDSPSQSEPTPTPSPTSEEARSADAAEAAFSEWMNAENDGDCEGVKARVTQPDSIDCDLVVEQAGLWDGLVDDADYLSQYSTVTLNGESAVIEVEEQTDEILAWDLERVDGRWLIVSDADDA